MENRGPKWWKLFFLLHENEGKGETSQSAKMSYLNVFKTNIS